MGLVLNELSFNEKIGNVDDAQKAISSFLYIVKILNEKYGISVSKIYSTRIDASTELVKGISYYRFMKEYMPSEEERQMLLLLLTKTMRLEETDSIDVSGGCSGIGLAYANNNDGVSLSLKSIPLFSSEYIHCYIKGKKLEVRNIAEEHHIVLHAENIIVRLYAPNEKHGKKEYYRDGGIYVSPMDLDDDTAQKVLNKAFIYDGKLYGTSGSSIYEFRQTIGCIYHGFNVTSAIDEKTKEKILLEAHSHS